MSGIVTGSMPVLVAVDERRSRAWCPLNEGSGRVLRYGADDATWSSACAWMHRVLGRSPSRALANTGPLDLIALQRRALVAGDECHHRTHHATRLVHGALASHLPPRVSAFILGNHQFALNLAMVAAKSRSRRQSDAWLAARHRDRPQRHRGRREARRELASAGSSARPPCPPPHGSTRLRPCRHERDLGDSAIVEVYGSAPWPSRRRPSRRRRSASIRPTARHPPRLRRIAATDHPLSGGRQGRPSSASTQRRSSASGSCHRSTRDRPSRARWGRSAAASRCRPSRRSTPRPRPERCGACLSRTRTGSTPDCALAACAATSRSWPGRSGRRHRFATSHRRSARHRGGSRVTSTWSARRRAACRPAYRTSPRCLLYEVRIAIEELNVRRAGDRLFDPRGRPRAECRALRSGLARTGLRPRRRAVPPTAGRGRRQRGRRPCARRRERPHPRDAHPRLHDRGPRAPPVAEHLEITEAVLSGDPDASASFMCAHAGSAVVVRELVMALARMAELARRRPASPGSRRRQRLVRALAGPEVEAARSPCSRAAARIFAVRWWTSG